VTVALVLTEVVGAILLALALAVPVLGAAIPRRRGAAVARFGVDLLLLALAVGAWWQVHSQPSTSTSGDTTRTLAPLICIAAATVVGVRFASLLIALVARIAARSTALVLPLASSQAARRPYAGVALALLAMAAASATFGIALQATWERSQGDQAALRVGTDLALVMSTPATDREAVAIATATGGAASAVTDRPLALGRYVGNTGSPPRLVAVDSRRAGQLLRGRLDDHRSWSSVGDLLSPGPSVEGLQLTYGGLTVKGTAPDKVAVSVTPTFVVQDASGFRRTVSALAVPLDGRPHRLRGLGAVAGTHLVAARLTLSGLGSQAVGPGTVSVALSAAGPGTSHTPSWHVRALGGRESPVQGSAIKVAPSATDPSIRITAEVDLQFLSFSDADLLATAYETPTALPVAVSQRLADQIGAKVGGKLSATVGDIDIPVRVATVIPTVPSEPGNPAMLADADTLSRMLIGAGSLEPAVDAWWVADPSLGTARALTHLDLGDVTSRSDVSAQLRHGPLRASIPAALTLLVVAAALLLLAGAALVIGADRPARSAEVARLRALGLTRGAAVRLVLTEHGILLGALVLMGTLVGVIASLALGPSLIRSDVGIAPVPAAMLEWPRVRGMAVLAGVLLGCLVIAAVITIFAVRRSGVVQLREVD
jgi:hypothetical protein